MRFGICHRHIVKKLNILYYKDIFLKKVLEVPRTAMNVGNFQIIACLAIVLLVSRIQMMRQKNEKVEN